MSGIPDTTANGLGGSPPQAVCGSGSGRARGVGGACGVVGESRGWPRGSAFTSTRDNAPDGVVNRGNWGGGRANQGGGWGRGIGGENEQNPVTHVSPTAVASQTSSQGRGQGRGLERTSRGRGRHTSVLTSVDAQAPIHSPALHLEQLSTNANLDKDLDWYSATEVATENTEVVFQHEYMVHRALPKLGPEAPTRPNYGVRGRTIHLRANRLAVQIIPTTLYVYHVHINPGQLGPRRRVHRIYQLAEQTLAWERAGMVGTVAHDGSAKLVASHQLPQPLNINVPYHEEGAAITSQNRPVYTLSITLVQQLHTQELIRYLEGQIVHRDYDISPILAALNLVHVAAHGQTGAARHGRRHFFHASESPISLDAEIEAWRGYSLAVQSAPTQLMIKVDVGTALFHSPGNLATVIEALQANATWLRRFRPHMMIETTHINSKKRVRRLATENANTHFIETPDFGHVTVRDYFLRKYQFPLQLPENVREMDSLGPSPAHSLGLGLGPSTRGVFRQCDVKRSGLQRGSLCQSSHSAVISRSSMHTTLLLVDACPASPFQSLHSNMRPQIPACIEWRTRQRHKYPHPSLAVLIALFSFSPHPFRPPLLSQLSRRLARPFSSFSIVMASSLQHTASLSAADVSILDEFHLRVTTIGIVLDCEVCGNALTLTLCQTDRRGNAGKPMARHPQCEFFKWFPRLLVYPQIIALITSLSPSVAQRAAPGPSINGDKKPRRHGNRCAGPLCRRSAALRCAREMCLSHCKDVGGCPFHGIIDPNSEEIVLDEDESLDFAPSPAAAPAFDYEYEDLPLPSQSQSTQPLLSQGTRQSLPSSSQSRSSQPLPPQETRHSATSSLQTDDGGKIRPRITRQLDPLWMSDLNQRARREVEDQKAAERRKEMEQAAKRRFILYWFDQDDVPASRRWITNCPYFPQYQLISDLDVLSVLGEDVSQIEVFEPSLHQWIAAGLDYTFTVQSGGHVFIRRFGVTRCALFDDLLNASKDSGRPTHIRHNLRGERDGTRAKLLKLKALSPIKDQSDSDIEIVEVTMRENRKRVRSSSVVSTAAHSRSSLSRASSLAMIDELSGSSQPRSPSPSSSTSPSTIHSFATQTSSSSLSTQPPPPSQCYPGPLHLPVVTPVLVPTYEGRQVWPHGMYTQDMVCGFRQLADKKLQACYPPHMLFKMVFGVSFIKGTYYDNLKAWTKTNHHVLAQCEAAGRTPQGLWCYYLAARREALGMKSKVKARKLM